MRLSLPTSLRWALAAVALLSGISSLTHAQASVHLDGASPARWIAPPDVPGDSFLVFHARRVVELPSVPARFVVHVSADNRYRLFVNGASVSSGPQRSDVTHWRYETLDLAPSLRPGRNVVAAVIWNWGAARPVAQHSYRTGFLLQGDDAATAALVNTGPGWKLLVDSAYAPNVITNATVAGYYAAVPGELVNGVHYPWGWEQTDYDDAGWFAVERTRSGKGEAPLAAFDAAGGAIVGRAQSRAPVGPGSGEVIGWQLEPRSIPPMDEILQRLTSVRRRSGVSGGDAFLRGVGNTVVPAHTRATLLLDQGHTTNAYPVLETSGGAGSTVKLTYAEALIDAHGEKGNRNEVEGRTIRGVYDVYRPDGGARRIFQPLYWRSFRYIQLDIETTDAPLTIHDVHGIFTAYPLRERARFASDLSWLSDMWRMDWNGARIGAFETYMDTPYYEQLQYVGDTRVQALISLYMSGDDRLVRQAIEQFDASRIPEGLTTSRYPSALTQIIPPFSLIYVAMVHDYHMLRDDPAFVRQRLAGMRGVLEWYARRVDSTGMLGPMPYWNYVDWAREWDGGVPPGAFNGHSTTITLLYAYALEQAAELESDLGVSGLGVEYRARAAAAVAAVHAHAWDARRGLFRDSPESSSFSQQTNALAILAGAVPSTQQRRLMERVLADSSLTRSTYYFSFYLFEAMRQAGLADRTIEQLAPWRAMLALGLTSTPENPEPTRSDSHAWAAHPNYELLATVLGVRPASAGFRTVRIAPALGPLSWAEGRVPHPAGDIDVRLTRVGVSGVRATVTLPPGMRGEFVWAGRRLPLHPGRQEIGEPAPTSPRRSTGPGR
jgi:alpha-L-rhamnosidase